MTVLPPVTFVSSTAKQYFEIDGATAKVSTTFRRSREEGLKQYRELAADHKAWLLGRPGKIAAVISARNTQ